MGQSPSIVSHHFFFLDCRGSPVDDEAGCDEASPPAPGRGPMVATLRRPLDLPLPMSAASASRASPSSPSSPSAEGAVAPLGPARGPIRLRGSGFVRAAPLLMAPLPLPSGSEDRGSAAGAASFSVVLLEGAAPDVDAMLASTSAAFRSSSSCLRCRMTWPFCAAEAFAAQRPKDPEALAPALGRAGPKAEFAFCATFCACLIISSSCCLFLRSSSRFSAILLSWASMYACLSFSFCPRSAATFASVLLFSSSCLAALSRMRARFASTSRLTSKARRCSSSIASGAPPSSSSSSAAAADAAGPATAAATSSDSPQPDEPCNSEPSFFQSRSLELHPDAFHQEPPRPFHPPLQPSPLHLSFGLWRPLPPATPAF
mmetsp:Transcript_87264/g.281934  ORF Transcript_87264/g.281934 Transcript_87264/m.281934 type:complete len:373 (-) Transcript_87264:303-1421(-)